MAYLQNTRPLQNCTSKTVAMHASFFKRDAETTNNAENLFISLSFSVKPGEPYLPYPRSHVAIKDFKIGRLRTTDDYGRTRQAMQIVDWCE